MNSLNEDLSADVIDINLGFMGLRINVRNETTHSHKVLGQLSSSDLELIKNTYNPEYRPFAHYVNGGFWDQDEFARFEMLVIRHGNYRELVDFASTPDKAVRVSRKANEMAQFLAVGCLQSMILNLRKIKSLGNFVSSAGIPIPIEILIPDPKEIAEATRNRRRFIAHKLYDEEGNYDSIEVTPFMSFIGNERISLTTYIVPSTTLNQNNNGPLLEISALEPDSFEAMVKSHSTLASLWELSSCYWHFAPNVDFSPNANSCVLVLSEIKRKIKRNPLSLSMCLVLSYLGPHMSSFSNEEDCLCVFDFLIQCLSSFALGDNGLIKVLPTYLTNSFALALLHVVKSRVIPLRCCEVTRGTIKNHMKALED